MPGRRSIVALLLVISTWLCPVAAVSAHSAIKRTLPADGEVLKSAPAAIELEFSQSVRLTSLTVKLHDTEVAVTVDSSQTSRVMRVALPALPAGDYSVDWRALSADGHAVSGRFSFTVAHTDPESAQ